ncbi:aminotransferase class V-fold PLP-dependent enzyme [Proteiniclasticum sp. C24MP]|uniref:aminotransferase class V-fold PLP-dependent enzyme n=1 Tax=Proteiniclasticum sp. C24MP TaxID=3374101 RepID=UPI003754FEAF
MIYFDNASTSFLKPQSVYDAVYDTLKNGTGNSGRGANTVSMAAGKILEDCRAEISQLLSCGKTENIILKSSVTEALNTILIGLLKPGDHVISSVMEHNSVLRPLEKLRKDGLITYDLLPCDSNGKVQLDTLPDLEKVNTKAVILSHVSNLTGAVQPVELIRDKIHNKDIFIIIDAAQSAGYIKVDMQTMDLDAVAFTGHKGLLGPQGTGGFAVNDRMNQAMDPVFTGGTGSDSLSLDQPLFLPDKFESGTHNLPGIAGLREGVRTINEIGIAKIVSEHMFLSDYFLDHLGTLDSIELMGKNSSSDRIPNFSLVFNNMDCSEAAFILENRFGIITRSGYHCAPLAHKALGTGETGSLRISFGHYTRIEDIDQLLIGLKYISEVNYGGF